MTAGALCRRAMLWRFSTLADFSSVSLKRARREPMTMGMSPPPPRLRAWGNTVAAESSHLCLTDYGGSVPQRRFAVLASGIGSLLALNLAALPAHARWPSNQYQAITLAPGGVNAAVQDACSDGLAGPIHEHHRYGQNHGRTWCE